MLFILVGFEAAKMKRNEKVNFVREFVQHVEIFALIYVTQRIIYAMFVVYKTSVII